MKETTRLVADDLILDLVKQQVIKKRVILKLSDLSYRTLLVLLKNAPHVVSVDELIAQVWQGARVSPDTVTQRIALLRKSLSVNKNENNRYIVSVRNQGYRFLPIVKEKRPKDWHVTHLMFALLAMMISAFFWWYVKETKTNEQPIKINVITQSDDFSQKGWRYIKKHDAKNNRLAIEMFNKSLHKQADNLDGLVGLSMALSHEVSKFNQTNELLIQAISLAERASQLYPDESKSWNALGFAYDVRGDIDTAISYYKKSLNLNPQRSSTKASLAFLHGIKGELLQSLKINLQVLNSDLEYINLQVAQNLHLLGFLELADQWYQRANMLSPDSVFASTMRVRFLISNQRFQEAESLLDHAKDRGIDRPEIYTLQGILQMIRGDKISALEYFERALTINEEDFEAQIWVLILSDAAKEKIKKFEDMWLHKRYYWPSDMIHKVIVYASLGARDEMLAGLKDAFDQGYMDSQWLLQLPPIKPYLSDNEFLYWIDRIQQKADSQRHKLLTINWLPIGFLDPTLSNQ